MKRYIFLLISCYYFVAGATGDLRQFADSLRTSCKIPELAYAIVRPDSIYALQVIGHHRAFPQPSWDTCSSNDYFHLGSNSKAITAFIAARLVEQGKIKWETKFFKLFPKMKKGSDTAYYNINLRDLLSHRARIEPYESGLEYQELPNFKGNTAARREQFVQYVLREKPVRRSDALYHYSNAGYSVAALMLEKVSGKTWEQLVHLILSDSLHLRATTGWPNRMDSIQPWGHVVEDGALWPTPADFDYDLAMAEPAGDISMPIADYATFVRMNLRGLLGHDNFLKASTYNFLHYGSEQYAMGWLNTLPNASGLSEHAGSAGTFYCFTMIDLKSKAAYIVIANSADPTTKQALFRLIDAMIEEVKRNP